MPYTHPMRSLVFSFRVYERTNSAFIETFDREGDLIYGVKMLHKKVKLLMRARGFR